MEMEKRRPALKKERMAMLILATPTQKPARLRTKRVPIIALTNGISNKPPPGCIICDTKEEDMI